MTFDGAQRYYRVTSIKPNYSYDFVIAVDSFDPAAAGPFSLSISW